MKDEIRKSEELEEERDDAVIGVAIRYSMIAGSILLAVAGTVFAVTMLNRPSNIVLPPKPVSLPAVRTESEQKLPQIPFTDITETAGISFIHTNGATGEKLLPETMGGGCAFFDYNNDGFADILLVNSKPWDRDLVSDDSNRQKDNLPTLALYENDGRGNFRDATSEVGLDVSLYGQGCAIGDFDNDGDSDLFISAVSEGSSHTTKKETMEGSARTIGPNRLFRNDAGTFVDITISAGVSGDPKDWGSSCGWFDYDNDADLDLWVSNYIEWSREFDLAQNFRLTGGERAYGRPQAFGGSYPHLYRNDGDGQFTEVSEEAGIRINAATTGTPLAKSLGLTFQDFDRDGNLDVVVANDTVQNNLFRNKGDGTFQEMAAIAGIAFDADGNARGAMGIDVACARDDSRCACVAIGNFANEMTAFYVSSPGSLVFSDQAVANGIGPSTRLFLTFGVFFFDADLDGWDDIFHANGHLEQDISKVQASQTYEQSPQLFWNAGPEAMTEYVPLPPTSTGTDFSERMVGRGAAYADIDQDGDLDILIATTGAKCRLLRNDQKLGNHWLRLRLIGNGTTSNRDAIGAKIDILLKSGRTMAKIVNPTRSYLSQVELPISLGLSSAEQVKSLSVRWPDGKNQSFALDKTDQVVDLVQAQ